MKRRITHLSLLAVFLLSPCAWARTEAEVVAKVIAVIDGDTLLLMPIDSKRGHPRIYKLRLADIDAPEKDQPFGEEAKRELAKLVLHQQIYVVMVATDHYGRRIGWVRVARTPRLDINVNVELVQRGWAWAFTRYRRHPHLQAAQQAALHSRRGLWAEERPVPPWVWRKRFAHTEFNPASASTPLPSPLRD